MAVEDVEQLPGIMPVQLRFHRGWNARIHKKEGVVARVGQFKRSNCCFHCDELFYCRIQICDKYF